MSTAISSPGEMPVWSTSSTPSFSWRFLWQEYLHVLRSRRAKLLLFVMIYAVFGVPFVLKKPPAEILGFVGQWFGKTDIQLKLFLFIWTDVAMNKIAVLSGIVLAGGIVTDERARGSLLLLLAKPISHAHYFLTKVVAAALVFASMVAFALLLGVLYFPFAVNGFRVVPFLCLGAVHLFAMTFAVILSGTMALVFARKLTAMITSLMILFGLIGSAFLGFYNPAWVVAGYLNPFYHGVRIIGEIGHLTPWVVLNPLLILLVFNVAVVAIGTYKARFLGD